MWNDSRSRYDPLSTVVDNIRLKYIRNVFNINLEHCSSIIFFNFIKINGNQMINRFIVQSAHENDAASNEVELFGTYPHLIASQIVTNGYVYSIAHAYCICYRFHAVYGRLSQAFWETSRIFLFHSITYSFAKCRFTFLLLYLRFLLFSVVSIFCSVRINTSFAAFVLVFCVCKIYFQIVTENVFIGNSHEHKIDDVTEIVSPLLLHVVYVLFRQTCIVHSIFNTNWR